MQRDGWSLEPDAWRQLPGVLRGAQWQRVQLRALDQDSVPQRAGIYLLTTAGERLASRYQLPRDLSNAIYVGRSDNLRRRFGQHLSPSVQNPLIARSHAIFGQLVFAFATVPDESIDVESTWLSRVESELIQVLSPPANRNVPRAGPILARLREPQPV